MPTGPPPGFLLILSTLAQIAAAVFSVLLAHTRAEHRPIAAFLSLVAAANLGLLAFVLFGAPVSLPLVPYVGMARVVFHAREALWFTWSFGLVAVAVAIFTKRSGLVVVPLYILTVLAFIVGYPALGGAALQNAYKAVEYASLVIGTGLLIQWSWRRESVSVTKLVFIFLLFTEFAMLVGPWQKDVFSGWDAARLMYAVSYLLVATIQGGIWWKRSN